jgi:hypothetical protein
VSTKNKRTLKTHYPYLLKWGISYAYPTRSVATLETTEFLEGHGFTRCGRTFVLYQGTN